MATETCETNGNHSAVVEEMLPKKRSRRLLLMERLLYREGESAFACAFTVRVRGQLNEERLRLALKIVQHKHPLLRCKVTNETIVRFVQQERPAPIPLKILPRASAETHEEEAWRDCKQPFDSDKEPLARAIWIRGSAVSELILVVHHCICDAHCGIGLIRDLLTSYDQPELPLDGYEALGGIADLIPKEVLRDRRFHSWLKWKLRVVRFGIRLRRARTRAHKATVNASRSTYFYRWNLDSQIVAGLRERCRRENVTLSAAMHVCFVHAFGDVRGERGLKRVKTALPTRTLLPQLHPDALLGITAAVELDSSRLGSVDDVCSAAFWDCARGVAAELVRKVDAATASLYGDLASSEYLHDRYEELLKLVNCPRARRSLSVYNLGRVQLQPEYRNFFIEKVFSPMMMLSPTPATALLFSSFRDEMDFVMVSDEGSLPQVQALRIAERAMAILKQALAVDGPIRQCLRSDRVHH